MPTPASTSRPARALAALLLACASSAPALGQTPTQALKRMSLEDLMNLEVSTVSRVPEPTGLVPAAVHVITREDIRRSGATSLPEILRLAPGVQVARMDAARYAIGIRGFADRLARAMLVLVDGRAVYTPLFAGTYWEVQDTLLGDIERIEVVRGPGGTLWGSNAINGIINIVTRRAADTQGLFATATAGSGLAGPVGVRYGGAAGPRFHVRGYAKAFGRDALFHPDGAETDDWHMAQGGLRADWSLDGNRSLTLQGDLYGGRLGQRVSQPTLTPPFSRVFDRQAPLSGGNVLARWSGPTRAGDLQFQAYYDRTRRDERPVAETRDTFDADLQASRRLGANQTLSGGLGYRASLGRITAVAPSSFTPADRTDHLYSAFLQDELILFRDRLRLIFGARAEHNRYTGLELQPSGRVVWVVNPSHTLLWSVTRAVRTPSRVETDYATESLANPAIPAFVRLRPNPAFQAEELLAFETGYRIRPAGPVYVSVSGFFNRLTNTLSTDLLGPFVETSPPPARLVFPVTFSNTLHGNSHGFEVTGDVRPANWWRVTADYAFLRVQMTRDPGSADVSQERRYEGLAPRHQAGVQSGFDLPGGVTFDWRLRYASDLPAGPVPAYATSNVRLAWRPAPQLEVAVVGQDLHDARHLEWAGAAQVRRSAHVTVTWQP